MTLLERAREVTRNGKYTYIEYARFADDLVILIDAYKRHDWLIGAVERRLREEFGKLQVEINDEKSRIRLFSKLPPKNARASRPAEHSTIGKRGIFPYVEPSSPLFPRRGVVVREVRPGWGAGPGRGVPCSASTSFISPA